MGRLGDQFPVPGFRVHGRGFVTEPAADLDESEPRLLVSIAGCQRPFEQGSGPGIIAAKFLDLGKAKQCLGTAFVSTILFTKQFNRAGEEGLGIVEAGIIQHHQPESVGGVRFTRCQLQVMAECLFTQPWLAEVVPAPAKEVPGRWVDRLGVRGLDVPVRGGGVSLLTLVGEAEEEQGPCILAIGLHPVAEADAGGSRLILFDQSVNGRQLILEGWNLHVDACTSARAGSGVRGGSCSWQAPTSAMASRSMKRHVLMGIETCITGRGPEISPDHHFIVCPRSRRLYTQIEGMRTGSMPVFNFEERRLLVSNGHKITASRTGAIMGVVLAAASGVAVIASGTGTPVTPQARMGDPLLGLDTDQATRFVLGKIEFQRNLSVGEGLGPIFNQTSCASCHNNPVGGHGNQTVTRFGHIGKKGGFDPLDALGGSLLQANANNDDCIESVPPEANITTLRVTLGSLGFGLIEAIEDSEILANRDAQDASIRGTARMVPVLENPGEERVGRFGWKSQLATVLSFSADAALNEMGLTNRIIGTENAPNGDDALLLECDTVPDPEDVPDAGGVEFIDRVTDFQRLLAALPRYREVECSASPSSCPSGVVSAMFRRSRPPAMRPWT